MTYAAIADRLGVSGEAARQLVRRRGWHRIVPNRPGATTTVIVPVDELVGTQGRDAQPADIGDTRSPDGATAFETALAAIEAAHASEVAALRAQVDTSEQARIAMQALADRTLTQLADAEAAVGTERQRADALRDRVAVLQAQADAAETAARELRQAEAVRKARGRLRRAWDGWRGR